MIVETALCSPGNEVLLKNDARAYFRLAITLRNKQTLVDSPAVLIEDAAFVINSCPPLLQLVANCFYRDGIKLQPKAAESQSNGTAAAADGKGGGLKGAVAKGAKGASAGVVENAMEGDGTTGVYREALYFLSSFLRESKPLWLDETQLNLSADLHAFLQKVCPLYAERCLLKPDALPEVGSVGGSGVSTVSSCSVSTLWQPAYLQVITRCNCI
jgi:hypothetical protein